MTEREIFSILKRSIEDILEQKSKPVRVGINGIEGTGKTTFANKLTNYLIKDGLNAIQVSIDGFHFNRKHRYRQGRDLALGYYEDSHNELMFIEKVLLASQLQKPNYTSAIHDLETDKYLQLEPIQIPGNTVLITDGAYLYKPIIRKYWDLKIYLKTDFDTALLRGVKRDLRLLGGSKAAKEKYNNRYHKASKMYIQENNPEQQAEIVIDNTDFENLKVIKNMASKE